MDITSQEAQAIAEQAYNYDEAPVTADTNYFSF
jgi:hypothetical protein